MLQRLDKISTKYKIYLNDIQLQDDGNYQILNVYQNNLMKCIHLRPLKTKRFEDVAFLLLNVILGAPCLENRANCKVKNVQVFAIKIIKKFCET